MPAQERLNDLAERRRLLVLESDLHRSVVQLELESLRGRVAGLRELRERLSAGSPWLVGGSALAGLVAVRHWRKLAHWIPAAFAALRWVRSLKGR